MIEGDWFFPEFRQLLVQYIEHFQERHMFRDVGQTVRTESAFVLRAGLSPDAQCQIHSRTGHYL
jgi:hypothetical protein